MRPLSGIFHISDCLPLEHTCPNAADVVRCRRTRVVRASKQRICENIGKRSLSLLDLLLNPSQYFYSSVVSASSHTSMPSSSSCFGSTGVGASVIRQDASFTFGNAMTSRMLSQPPISITTRSRPYARPACGGTPYLNASSRKPNCSCAFYGVKPSTSNILDWISLWWIRTEPPPISVPFNTISYAFARTAPGSVSIKCQSSSIGMVNG